MNRLTLLVLGCAAVAAMAADVIRPVVPPKPARIVETSGAGALACANVRTGSASGQVVLASHERSSVRVTFVPRKGKAVDRVFDMEPRTTRAIAIPDGVKGDVSAIVRYTGGPVAAAHTMAVRRDRESSGGVAAASCSRAAGATLAVTQLRTLRATSVLTLFNPGAGRASVHVSLHADGRPLFPTDWTSGSGVYVPPRGRVDLRLGDFAFDSRRLTTVITAVQGRVVAEALVRSATGVALISATPPLRSMVATSARSGNGATFGVGLVGDEDAGLDARFMTTTEQGRAGGLPDSLEPSQTARIKIPARNEGGAVAYALDLTIGSPVVAATVWERVRAGRREQAAAEAVAPANRWLAVLAGREGATLRTLIVNPGSRSAALTVTRFGQAEESYDVEPGRVLVLTVGEGRGIVGVDVASSEPVSVFTDASGASSAGGWTFGYPAAPLRPGKPVGAVTDPRVGVPGLRVGEGQ